MPRKPTGTSCYLDQRADSPYWYVCEWDAPNRRWRRKSTRTADHSEAQKILAEHILALETRCIVSDASVLHVVLRYWTRVAHRHFASYTTKRVMALVNEHLSGVRIFDWPTEDQRAFIAKLANAKTTQRRYWSVILAAAAWMASDEVQELPSMPKLVKIKLKGAQAATTTRAAKPFSVPDFKRLFEVAKHEHEQRLLLLCLVTDHRPGAVLDLTWDRIDLDQGFADLRVPGRPVTNKRRGIVPLSPTVIAYLRDRRSIGPVIQWKGRRMKTFEMTFLRLVKDAGITGSAYSVRKGVATYLRSQGISVPDIKAMLSHSLGGETDEYAHYDPAYMAPVKAAFERLLAHIAPGFLASYLPVKSQGADSGGNNGGDGSLCRVQVMLDLQQLEPANADSCQQEETKA